MVTARGWSVDGLSRLSEFESRLVSILRVLVCFICIIIFFSSFFNANRLFLFRVIPFREIAVPPVFPHKLFWMSFRRFTQIVPIVFRTQAIDRSVDDPTRQPNTCDVDVSLLLKSCYFFQNFIGRDFSNMLDFIFQCKLAKSSFSLKSEGKLRMARLKKEWRILIFQLKKLFYFCEMNHWLAKSPSYTKIAWSIEIIIT